MFVASGSQELQKKEVGDLLASYGACDAVRFLSKQVYEDYFYDIRTNVMWEMRDRDIFEKYRLHDMYGFKDKEDEEAYGEGVQFVGDTIFGEEDSEEKSLFYDIIRFKQGEGVTQKGYKVEGYDIPDDYTFFD